MLKDWKSRATSAEDALALIRSNMRIFIHGASATPTLTASKTVMPASNNGSCAT